MKGMSPAVTTALLILVSIAVVAAIYMYAARLSGGSDVVTAQATLITSRYVRGNPVYVIDIGIQSKAKNRLHFANMTIITTDTAGNVNTMVYSPSSSSSSSSPIKVDPANFSIDPNKEQHVTVALTGTPLTSVSFKLYFTDDAGNVYSVSTNEVQVS
jgi:hypothetical protein